ncbi:hypothetical protein JQS43_21530 [Natronosporangium hydrolyticum]|uniref:Sec-independent protein translocase protein TatB n=1 Tax=Natronosporangium hydrolyticum TaxID=2811111 RepID=A0A895YHR4_9ACTN|nr:hypothetical protein JQS43_21530 [Natronosporangium hydrolyticum]
MFSNLNWYNVAILLLLALFIFGDKLPQMITDGLRMVRNLRRMAQNATSDLSRELGTDIRVEDLHPKAFVRKHLLSEADQEKLLQPIKGISEDVLQQTKGIQDELKEVGRQADQVAGEVKGATGARRGNGAKQRRGGEAASATGDGSAAVAGATGAVAAGAAGAGEPTERAAESGGADAAPPAGRPRFDDIT